MPCSGWRQMTEAIEALQAYRLKLKEQNKTLHASVVARCIRVLERAGK
jgi:ribosomal protein L28